MSRPVCFAAVVRSSRGRNGRWPPQSNLAWPAQYPCYDAYPRPGRVDNRSSAGPWLGVSESAASIARRLEAAASGLASSLPALPGQPHQDTHDTKIADKRNLHDTCGSYESLVIAKTGQGRWSSCWQRFSCCGRKQPSGRTWTLGPAQAPTNVSSPSSCPTHSRRRRRTLAGKGCRPLVSSCHGVSTFFLLRLRAALPAPPGP